MKSSKPFIILVLSTCFFISSHSLRAHSDPIKDSLGRTISGNNKTVISLSPAITELLFAMGLGDKITGVSDFSDFPKEAKEKTHVGPYTNPNIEAMVALRPDLVIVPDEGPEDIRTQMDRLPLAYAVVKMRKIDEIPEAAEMMASWVGAGNKGKTFKDTLKENMRHIFAKVRPRNSRPPIRALVEIQNEPLIAAGKETFLDEIISRCGAVNVIQEKNYPHVSLESLVKKNIDIVFLADYFAKDSERNKAKSRWKKFPSTEDARVIVLDPDTTSRPGPRLIEGIQKICNAVYEQGI